MKLPTPKERIKNRCNDSSHNKMGEDGYCYCPWCGKNVYVSQLNKKKDVYTYTSVLNDLNLPDE